MENISYRYKTALIKYMLMFAKAKLAFDVYCHLSFIISGISEYELLIMTKRAYFIISIKADFDSVHSVHLSFYFEHTHTSSQLDTACLNEIIKIQQPKKKKKKSKFEKEFNLASKSLADIPILICMIRWPTLQASDYVIPYCIVMYNVSYSLSF